jgi:Flp pilus assembly protein TadG
MVETALVFGLLVMVLFGAIELGRAWFSKNVVTHAVREAARLAAVTPGLRPDDQTVLNKIDAILQQGGLQAQSKSLFYTAPLRTGRIVRVTAEVSFTPIIALWVPGATLTIPLKAEVMTRYEV